MKRTESGMEYCTCCVHFGYCMVYWGVECKRQGGKRIPRMKPTPADICEQNARARTEPIQVSLPKTDVIPALGKQKLDKPKNTTKPDMLKRIVGLLEPIRTKVSNW